VTSEAPYDEPRDADSAARGIAILRLVLVGVMLVQAQTSGPRLTPDRFPLAIAAFAAYALAALVLAWRPRARTLWPLGQALADLVFIAALVYTSGGARSPLRFAFFALPLGAAVRLSPRLTSLWAALAVGAYLAVVLPHPLTDLSSDLGLVAGQALSLLWVSAAAVMLSAFVGRRQDSLIAMAAARRLLVQAWLAAEARERRRLAQALHDDAIQNLLFVRQEIVDEARGVPGAADRALAALDTTHHQLREEIFAMHPVGLERGGLAAVLRGCADDAARRGHFSVELDVDDAASGPHDDLLLSSARELLSNAAQHSGAAHVRVAVHAGEGSTELVVSDDGRGIPDGALDAAPRAGHIGLPSLDERVRAVGGSLRLERGHGPGTTIRVRVPAPRSSDRRRRESAPRPRDHLMEPRDRTGEHRGR